MVLACQLLVRLEALEQFQESSALPTCGYSLICWASKVRSMMRKRAEDIITYELSKETRAYERSKNGGAIAVFLSSSACLEEKSCISYLTNTTGNLVR